MTTIKTFRVAASALLVMAAFSAHAGLRLECPVRWDQLTRLNGDLDADLFGVKVRDWKPAQLDEVLRKSEECSRSGPGSESMRRAEHMDGASRVYPAAKGFYLADRDRHLQEEAARNQASTAIKQANLSQISVDRNNGAVESVEVDYGQKRVAMRCDKLGRGIGFATVESYRQAAAFAKLCAQSQAADGKTAALYERQAAEVPGLYSAMGMFASQMAEVAARPLSEARVQELAAVNKRLSAQMESLGLTGTGNFYPQSELEKTYTSAVVQLEKQQKQLEVKACEGQFLKAGMPGKWKANLIIMELNSPEPFQPLVCSALRNEAQVRYLSGGLLSKEGFEVKSPKRTVQVFVGAERVPGGDPDIQVMVPVTAKIDSKSVDVTRANLRAVAAELIAAMRNQ